MKIALVISMMLFAYIPSFTQTKSLRDFGAKGDGIYNDYNALLAAAKYFNERGTGTLIIPEGTYLIANMKKKGSIVNDIEFRNLKQFSIIGRKSKIVVDASDRRKIDYKKGMFNYSFTNAVSPFKFYDSSDISISGIEVNGGAINASKDNVIEGWSFLLYFEDCRRVSLKNLYLHHSLTDGLYIKGTNSSDFKVSDVICEFNARQGMSIVALKNGVFTNCIFSNTGRLSKYGYHKPAAGVDIETGNSINAVTNIVFEKCKFINNIGSQIVVTSPNGVNGVIISNSEITAQKGSSKYVVICGGKNIVVKNCKVDAGFGAIYANWKSAPGATVKILNCSIKSKAQGIIAEGGLHDLVNISGNSLAFYGDRALTTYFPYLKSRNLSFVDNKVVIPKSLHGDIRWFSLIQFASKVNGNIFIDEFGKSFLDKVSFHNSKLNANR